MKHIFNFLTWMGVATAVTLSCSRIQEEPALTPEKTDAQFHMQVKAGDPATKTVIDDNGAEYGILWQAGDALGVFEVGNGVVQAKAESDPLTSPAATATFGLSLSGAVEAPYDYTFVYPSSALSKVAEQYLITIPGEQTFPANSFDIQADVLVAEHQHFATDRPTELSARFARLGATARMVIKAPVTGERIQRITFSTTEGNLHGAYRLNPATGELSDAFVSGGNSLKLTPAQATTYSGEVVVWFRLGARVLADNFTVSVRTETTTYTKTVNLASASRTLAFADGKLTKFNVNMVEVVGEENTFEGDYAEFTATDAKDAGMTGSYSNLASYSKPYGDKWGGNMTYTAGNIGMNSGTPYIQLPVFSEELAYVTVTLATGVDSRTLFLSATNGGTLDGALASVSTSAGETVYQMDVRDQHIHTGFLRVNGGGISVKKVSAVAKNDARIALPEPTNLQASLDSLVKNTVHLSWTGVEDAAAYLVAYTPEGGSTSYVTVTDESVVLEALEYSTSYSYSVTSVANPYFQKNSAATAGASAIATGAQPDGMKVDEITWELTGVTTYTAWSEKTCTGGSTAEYAGYSRKGDNSTIQINSDNPMGLWTTGSGGYIRSVTLTLASGTNTVDVYAKNSKYESGHLYGTNSEKGTKVGSVTASSTEEVRQKITFSEDYSFLGIRSYSGANYILEIRIEWANSSNPNATVTTADATDIKAVNAVLAGSYSGATNGILEAGFYWDTDYTSLNNLAHPEQIVVAKDSDAATSGNFSCVLPSLTEQTRYYVKAYVVEFDSSTQTYVEHYGSIVNFQTLAKTAFTPGGWLEMPSYSVENMAGTTTSPLNDLYTVTHYAQMGGNNARNYSILYDPAMYVSYWVAYPLCAAHLGDGRKEDWGYDPIVPQAKQTSVAKGYGVSVPSDTSPNQLYARGHQLPNADRNGVDAMMAQTYFSTNMTPQLQNGFNSGVWSHLEAAVRSVAEQHASDTVYVVTGAAFRKKGGNETIQTITNRDGKVLPVPNYYWKVLLRVKWSNDPQPAVAGATAIGFWLEHRDNYDNGSSNYLPYVTSVDQIEEWTGFDFFSNLSTSLQSGAEAATDWAAFKAY